MITNFGDIYLYSNNHIDIIEHNRNIQRPIKIIILNDLITRIQMFNINNDYSFHVQCGLPSSIDKNLLISIVFNCKNNKFIKFHQFLTISSETNKNEFVYDIPYYNPKISKDFSIFSSDYEKLKIKEYEKMKKIKISKKKSIKPKNHSNNRDVINLEVK